MDRSGKMLPALPGATSIPMKAVILAGALGTRLAEETPMRPKPMAEIGSKPILRRIKKAYAHCWISGFVVCPGYKSYMINGFFANPALQTSDLTRSAGERMIGFHETLEAPWKTW